VKRLIAICLFTIFTLALLACNQEEDVEPVTLNHKFEYADFLDFTFCAQIEGTWVFGNNRYYRTSPIGFNPFSDEDSQFTDFLLYHSVNYTSDLEGVPESTIVATPNPENSQAVINAIHWEMLSAGDDPEKTLARFGLSYPVTVENLVDDWEKVYALLRRGGNTGRMYDIGVFAQVCGNDGSRIAFELVNIGTGSVRKREEPVLEILDRLGISIDEGAILLHNSGSFDAFVAITDLMLEEDLTFRQAQRRYERSN
jgi:hypothetical protein